jgi:hypothetical protein
MGHLFRSCIYVRKYTKINLPRIVLGKVPASILPRYHTKPLAIACFVNSAIVLTPSLFLIFSL